MLRSILVVLFVLSTISCFSQLESTQDSVIIRSHKVIRSSYSATGPSSSSFFFWHTYELSSSRTEDWIGIYGGRLTRQIDFDQESWKYMRNFRVLTVSRQATMAISLSIYSVFIYNAWVHEDISSPSQIGLAIAGAVPVTATIILPYFKKNALKKLMISHNRNRMK